MKNALKAVVLMSILPAPAMADLMGAGCFVRVYSAAHLRDHPLQQVTVIALRRAPVQDLDGAVLVDVGVEMRAWNEPLRGSAVCVPVGATLDCLLEGDAGAFTLEAGRGGALRLVVAPRGMAFEGTSDFAEISGTTGDDRLFLIPPGTGC